MPSGELLRAERHTFHTTEILRNPGEAHGVVLAVVRASCVALNASPEAVPARSLDGLVLFGESRRHGGTYIRAEAVEMAVDRSPVHGLLYVRRREASEIPAKRGGSVEHAERSEVDGAHCNVAPVLLLLLSLAKRLHDVF